MAVPPICSPKRSPERTCASCMRCRAHADQGGRPGYLRDLGARSKLQQAEGEAAQIRAQIREMAGRRGELEGARDRARNVGYHDPRDTFGGSGQEVLGQVIGGILGGMVSGGALDRVLRDNYRGRQARVDPGFGGRGSGQSRSGTWGGGAVGRSGGDDRGGGWRTGGSF